jgi:hypothetical protein
MGKHHKRHKVRREEIAGIAIREVRPGYWLVDFQRGGRRVRRAFKNLELAKTWAEGKKQEVVNKGMEVLNLSDKVRAEAVEAMRRLEGTGVGILEAIDDYLRRHPKTGGETVAQTCEKYLAAMQAAGRRPLSLIEKEVKFRSLCAAMGATPTAAVDMTEIEQWAQSQNVGKVTTEAYIGAGGALLQFFQRGCRLKNRRSNGDEKPPVTWNVLTVAKVMETAEKSAPDIVPALAVLFFAGIRPHEMLRLTWQQIDLVAGVIRLTGEETKTRTMRNVEIAANLRAWLTAYPGKGLVVATPSRYRDQRVAVMEKCDLAAWPVDVARHTFATMHYNAHQNAAATMAQLGHFGNPQTFVTHYKGVQAPPADVAAYWDIKPQQPVDAHKAKRHTATGRSR